MADLAEEIGQAIGQVAVFSRVGEGILAALGMASALTEQITRIADASEAGLIPELTVALDRLGETADALVSAATVAQTRYDLAVERIGESAKDKEEGGENG